MRPLEHSNGLVLESYAEIDVVSRAIEEACLAEPYRQLADNLNDSLKIAAGTVALDSSFEFDEKLKISKKPLLVLVEGTDATIVTEALDQFARPNGNTFERWLAQDMLDNLNSVD